jgi:tetratricopeptide (TPR) repeat protein
MLNVEEHYKNVFGLRTGQWIGQVECLVKLFQGLLQKEKYQTSSDPKIKAEALLNANRLFSDLSSCANDDSLKVFALQCKAWSELKMDDKETALETFNEILKVDPANVLALNNSGVLFLEQNDNLHAQIQFEKILEKNDVPSIRIANAEALSKLNRGEEAKKEIEHVEKSNDYHARKEMYDRKIRTIPTASFQPNPGLSAVSPSLSLSAITTQFNGGESEKAIKNLDILIAKRDSSFSKEDLMIMSEIYKNGGATRKARILNLKAENMGATVPVPTNTFSRAVRRNLNHQ